MKHFFLILLLASLAAGSARAQRSGTGLGVITGEPTGVSVKHWLDDRAAIDAAVGWSFEGRDSLHLHADWLWHDFAIFPVERGLLPLYYGVGARFKSNSGSRDRFGVRVPVGVAYHFDNIPLELFGEIVPILDVVPSTRLSLNAAVGARWYFH
ncbi:MAG: hypothetical protein WD490_07630 [Opitutales bacterium]